MNLTRLTRLASTDPSYRLPLARALIRGGDARGAVLSLLLGDSFSGYEAVRLCNAFAALPDAIKATAGQWAVLGAAATARLELRLSCCHVPDVSALALLPHLQLVELMRTGVSEEGAQALRRALPGCVVVHAVEW